MTRALAACVFGLVVAVAAAAFAVSSLYVPGIGVALAGAAAAGWVTVAARNVRVTRTLDTTTVEEGAPFAVEVDVERAHFGGELSDPLLARPARRIRSGRIRLVTRFERRGRHALGPATLVFRDPLRLAERSVRSGTDELLVLPRVEPVVADALAAGDGAGLDASAGVAHDAALEFDSLRPYRLGTPASRIHWPTVARHGTMMERRLVADLDARPLVVLDARNPDSDAALDRALRAAASLAVHLARGGGCAVLLPGERRPTTIDTDLRAWPPVHARLALVEPGGEASVPRRLERGGSILWVTASSGGPRGALARATAASRYLVAPEPLSGRAVAFTVAGCSGHALGARARSAA